MKNRSLSICLLLLSLLFSGWLQAAVELNEDVPETYIVKKGDTLWGISGMYLKEPWLWPELWDANPQIDNPHLIFPGDELYLVWIDGQPRLRLRRGRDVKLTPNMRVSPLDLAIPVIPLDQIGPWLRRNRVMDADEINQSAYIVAGDERRLISGPGDRIFGRGPFPDGERAYGIYRVGQNYLDPVTQEFLGYQVQVGGVMIAVEGGLTQIGEMSVVVINRGKRDGLQIGNVLAVYQAGKNVFDKVAQSNVILPDTRVGLAMVYESFEKVSYAIVLRTSRPLQVFDLVKNP